jgi:hypothetical protein
MAHRLERRSDLSAPAFAQVGRVFDGTCKIEKHEFQGLSAIAASGVNQQLQEFGTRFPEPCTDFPQETNLTTEARGHGGEARNWHPLCCELFPYDLLNGEE